MPAPQHQLTHFCIYTLFQPAMSYTTKRPALLPTPPLLVHPIDIAPPQPFTPCRLILVQIKEFEVVSKAFCVFIAQIQKQQFFKVFIIIFLYITVLLGLWFVFEEFLSGV